MSTRRGLMFGIDQPKYFWGERTGGSNVIEGDIVFKNINGDSMCITKFSLIDNGCERYNSKEWFPLAICIAAAGDVFSYGMFVGIKKIVSDANGNITEKNLNEWAVTNTNVLAASLYKNFSNTSYVTTHIPIISPNTLEVQDQQLSHSNYTLGFPRPDGYSSGNVYLEIDFFNKYYVSSNFYISPVIRESSFNVQENMGKWFESICQNNMYAAWYEFVSANSTIAEEFVIPDYAFLSGASRRDFYTNLLTQYENPALSNRFGAIYSNYIDSNLWYFDPSLWDMTLFSTTISIYAERLNELNTIFDVPTFAGIPSINKYETCDFIHNISDDTYYPITMQSGNGLCANSWSWNLGLATLPFFFIFWIIKFAY